MALTSSSPSRAEDSFCKTAMSRREDILSSIDVTIVNRSAHIALPSSYSKIFLASRASAAVTHAAGLGGKRFIDFGKPHACVSAFVQQHGSKCAPTGIEHRLGLSGLGQRRGIYVANEESPVGLDQTGAQFVQEIFSPIRDLRVNRSGSVLMASALCDGQRGFQVAVKTFGLDWWQRLITESCKGPQAQIDSQARNRAFEDRANGRSISFISHSLRERHTDIEIPASAGIFTEISRAQFEVGKTIAVPERQPTSGEVDLPAAITNRSDLEGNPAEGSPCTAALAPGQSNFLMLSAPSRVFFRNLLHRLNRKMQGAVTARDPFEERPEIESREKPPLALEYFGRKFVAVVKHRIDLARQTAQPLGVLVLYPKAQDPNSGSSRTGHPYSLPKTHSVTPTQVSRNAWR
jgi:hypothetical protein